MDYLFSLYFLIVGLCAFRIITRVGFSPWWALLAFVPGLNIAVVLLFAFGPWPIDAVLNTGAELIINKDVEQAFDEAVKHEKVGEWDKSIELYRFVTQYSTDEEMARYATDRMEELQMKMKGID